MIGVLKLTLSRELGWSEGDFANVIFYFTMAYAVGATLGYACAFVIWQVAHIAHGLAANVTQSRWRASRSASARPARTWAPSSPR
ncbi:hypothetical protein V2S85_26200 [Novosphingobium resinovorum]|nr:hypothetical protein [Novosphingobium resinovorum]